MNTQCPICKKDVTWEGNVFRPFCSERCQLLDLSGWLGERYRVPDDSLEEGAEPSLENKEPFP